MGEVFQAGGNKLIGEVRSDYNGFEWLGLDFMIDDDMNLQLAELGQIGRARDLGRAAAALWGRRRAARRGTSRRRTCVVIC